MGSCNLAYSLKKINQKRPNRVFVRSLIPNIVFDVQRDPVSVAQIEISHLKGLGGGKIDWIDFDYLT